MNNDVINKYKNSFITLGTIQLIVIILSLISNFNIIELIIAGISFILFFIGFCLADSKKKSAGYIGILIGILLLFSIIIKDYLSALIGVSLIISSIKYIKCFKKYIVEE